jgi:hypothetical protein
MLQTNSIMTARLDHFAASYFLTGVGSIIISHESLMSEVLSFTFVLRFVNEIFDVECGKKFSVVVVEQQMQHWSRLLATD